MNIADFFNSAESAVSYATTIAEVLLLIRLAWLGLITEFKAFSLFLAFDAVLTAALIGRDYHMYSYEAIWAVTTPVWTILLAGVAYELSRGLVQPIPRETINRNASLYGFLIGMTVSVVVSMWTHPQEVLRSGVLLTIIGRRSILCGCILAILFQGTVLSFGDAPIMSNWKLHRRVLLTLLTAVIANLFSLTSKNRHYGDWFNVVQNMTFLGCLCAWTLGFRRMFCDVWDYKGIPTDNQFAESIVYELRHRTRQAASTVADKPSPV